MKKTDRVRLLSTAVDDLKKITDFFEEKGEEIYAVEVKTPDDEAYVDITKGCFIETEISEKDFYRFKTYELAYLFSEVTIDNFRLLTEKTKWNYDVTKDTTET